MNPVEDTCAAIDLVRSFIENSPWKNEFGESICRLKARVGEPCVLAIAGRVKAGKSSLLNALLGKELAKVGTTETTATINIFRCGKPEDPEHPVKVVWENGSCTYETIEFMDSLQGNDKNTLQKAIGIKWLEFTLEDPILKEVTLVDTPGTEAIVDDDGDGHQRVTEEFFQLRSKHSQQTKQQTELADAVIYLTGPVPRREGKSFLQEFQSVTGNASSAVNSIGVMAKIDSLDDIVLQKEELAESIAKKMQQELSAVVPVSAGLRMELEILKKEGKIEFMQQQLQTIPQRAFDFMMKQESLYKSEVSLLGRLYANPELTPISLDDRLRLLGQMHWSIFRLISQHLYKYNLDEAMCLLTDISGIPKVKDTIKKHFFDRSKLLRCFSIVVELREMLSVIERNRLYELKQEVRSRVEFESFIESHPLCFRDRRVSDKLLHFIRQYIKTEPEVEELQRTLKEKLIRLVETLQQNLRHTDNCYHALQLMQQNRGLFDEEERSELFAIFGLYGDIPKERAVNRQQYWNMELNLTRNRDRKKVAEYAVSAYGRI